MVLTVKGFLDPRHQARNMICMLTLASLIEVRVATEKATQDLIREVCVVPLGRDRESKPLGTARGQQGLIQTPGPGIVVQEVVERDHKSGPTKKGLALLVLHHQCLQDFHQGVLGCRMVDRLAEDLVVVDLEVGLHPNPLMMR